jgi:hypothetical protein
MLSHTRSITTFLVPILGIVFLCPLEQVRDVVARRVVTTMQHALTNLKKWIVFLPLQPVN